MEKIESWARGQTMRESRLSDVVEVERDLLRVELAQAFVLVNDGVTQFQALADFVNQATALLTADGVVRSANFQLAALFGKLPHQLVGTALAEALPHEQHRLFRTLVRESLTHRCAGVSSASVFLLSGREGHATACRFSFIRVTEDCNPVIVLTATELPAARAAFHGAKRSWRLIENRRADAQPDTGPQSSWGSEPRAARR
jgi:PAS domain-containing protein